MSAAYPKLNSGDLRTKIEIRHPVKVDTGTGGRTTTWPVLASPRAEVIGQNGREAVIGQALQGISVYRIRIRYRPDLPEPDVQSYQIRLGAVDLNIRSCTDPNGDREQLVIFADTGSAQATS